MRCVRWHDVRQLKRRELAVFRGTFERSPKTPEDFPNPAAIDTTPAPAIDQRSLRLLDDQRCVYVFVLRKRAVAQPLEPVWWKSSLQARSLRP
ncbi:hypothetical protein NQZ68_017285 [Dissostichus eleginoides]|nr:hypothetical protein NQZ68_017285 [Dissostichus eleginoides]